jgi:hypothetical protein
VRFDRKATMVCSCGWSIRPGRRRCKACDLAHRSSVAAAQRCEVCGGPASLRKSGKILCRSHYRASQHKGPCLLCSKPVSTAEDKLCFTHKLERRAKCSMCERPVSARGLCITHYSQWRVKNIPHAAALARKYAASRREEDPAYSRRQVMNLERSYVTHLLRNEAPFLKEFPPELYEAKKEYLKFKRILRQTKKELEVYVGKNNERR